MREWDILILLFVVFTMASCVIVVVSLASPPAPLWTVPARQEDQSLTSWGWQVFNDILKQPSEVTLLQGIVGSTILLWIVLPMIAVAKLFKSLNRRQVSR